MTKVVAGIDIEVTDTVVSGFGPNKNGLCLLRIIKKEDKYIFVLTHSMERRSPSITDYIDDIAVTVCTDIFPNISRRKLVKIICASAWVEHWPKAIPMFGGSYAVICFDGRLNPAWSYASKEAIVDSLGISMDMLAGIPE